MKLVILLSALAAFASAQNVGTNTPEYALPISYQECSEGGSCTTRQGSVVLDSNWRWTHSTTGFTNCYTGNTWDAALCPDVDTCTANCAIDGVDQNGWTNTYGIRQYQNGVSLTFVTGANIGSRVYLLDSTNNYVMFQLLNKEFSFTVDDSELGCGLNGAVYLVEMEADGGLASQPTNRAGAQYGTGYCDAQCPHDMKWIDGKANINGWTPHPEDANSGKGNAGICCPEMDLWEANSVSQAYTSHPCRDAGYYPCEGTECGDNASDERYDGVCDKDGCDFASYRLGDPDFWGPGGRVNSDLPVQVVTQFITNDGTDSGELVEIRRLYVQGGQVIENSFATGIPGVEDNTHDSITPAFCREIKDAFGDFDHHEQLGGLRQMGEALGRGMVFVMSLWADFDAHMLWLDSTYPVDADPSQPGITRGPCDPEGGHPHDVEQQQPTATVYFTDIKVGPIGSTYSRAN